jgi:hypothetical protein
MDVMNNLQKSIIRRYTYKATALDEIYVHTNTITVHITAHN